MTRQRVQAHRKMDRYYRQTGGPDGRTERLDRKTGQMNRQTDGHTGETDRTHR